MIGSQLCRVASTLSLILIRRSGRNFSVIRCFNIPLMAIMHADDDGDIHGGTAPDDDPSRRRERVEQAMSRC